MEPGVDIQVNLNEDSTSEIVHIELSQRNLYLFDVPREELSNFYELPEADHEGIYFLLEVEEIYGEVLDCYVGRTRNVGNRLREHDSKSEKSFDRVLVFVPKSKNSWHAGYQLQIEKLAIQRAKAATKYNVTNFTKGDETTLTSYDKRQCNVLMRNMASLMKQIGEPLLKATVVSSQSSPSLRRKTNIEKPQEIEIAKQEKVNTSDQETFVSFEKSLSKIGQTTRQKEFFKIVGDKIDARGFWDGETFTLLSGSVISLHERDYLIGGDFIFYKQLGRRATAHDRRVKEDQLGHISFGENGKCFINADLVFSSPTAASDFVLNYSSNGKTSWIHEKTNLSLKIWEAR